MIIQELINIEDIATELCNQFNANLIKPLGSGAFKHVFLIQKNGTDYALKIANISSDLRARLERETQALEKCKHPSIATLEYVTTYSHGNSEYWVIIENYFSGGTLADKLLLGSLQETQINRIGYSISSALQHLHGLGLVHRDIKPSNILFCNQDLPVLTDFGIVRVLKDISLTHDFMAQGPGTPFYSAPEQLLNEKNSIDWRTDQFGLAVVLTECLLGRHAYAVDGKPPHEAVLSVANRDPLPEKTKVELNALGFGKLSRALSPWPVERYRWPEEFCKIFSVEM